MIGAGPARVCTKSPRHHTHGLDHRGDRLHFNSAAAEELGRRYAHAWLRLARPAETLCEAAPPPVPLCFPANGSGDVATEAAVVD